MRLRSGTRYVGRFGGALRYYVWRNPLVPDAWLLTTGTPTDELRRHVVVARGTAEDMERELQELGATREEVASC